MSVRRYEEGVVISCDRPDCDSTFDEIDPVPLETLRQSARDAGWPIDAGEDGPYLCPSCTAWPFPKQE